MKGIALSVMLWVLVSVPLWGQEAFYAQASQSEVEAGQLVEVEFIIRNMKGEFEAPDFNPFILVAGPMQSSSFQSINGQVTQEYRFKYILRAPEDGVYLLPEAELLVDDELFVTDPLEIIVLPSGQPGLQKQEPGRSPSPALRQILQRKKIKRF